MSQPIPSVLNPVAITRWQFSLRSLLGIMLVVAMLSGLWRIAPQLAVCVAGTVLTAIVSWRLGRAIVARQKSRIAAVLFVASWIAFYCVSVGPALSLTQGAPSWDPVFEFVYAPVEHVYQSKPCFHQAIDWYLHYWRSPID
jgi:hypothetical protein